jgi:integrase
MLVTTFGLRISDVFGLEFKCVDWINKKIRIVQKKTGKPLELPLTEAVPAEILAWMIWDLFLLNRSGYFKQAFAF